MFFLLVWKWHFNLAKLSKKQRLSELQAKERKKTREIFLIALKFFSLPKIWKNLFWFERFFFSLRILATKSEYWLISVYDGSVCQAACCPSEIWWSELQRGRRQRAVSFCWWSWYLTHSFILYGCVRYQLDALNCHVWPFYFSPIWTLFSC